MAGQIINGERWINERMKFLRARLAEDPPAGERTAIEAELETLSKERGLTARGSRAPKIFRRLKGKP